MTGGLPADLKAKNEALKKQIKDEKTGANLPVRVEHSSEVVTAVSHSVGVAGFDELPTSIIPLGYYRLVHPNSKGVTLADETRAEAGTYYTDIGEAVDSVRIAILRTKMGSKVVKNNGVEKIEPIIKMLAIDTKTLSPFLINFPKGCFSSIGRLMLEFKKKGIAQSYRYPVVLASEFIEGREFNYWTSTFSLEAKPFDQEEMEIMATAFAEYAGVLDKANFDDEENIPVKVVNPNAGKPGYDSAGNKIDDIPMGGETPEETAAAQAAGRPF